MGNNGSITTHDIYGHFLTDFTLQLTFKDISFLDTTVMSQLVLRAEALPLCLMFRSKIPIRTHIFTTDCDVPTLDRLPGNSFCWSKFYYQPTLLEYSLLINRSYTTTSSRTPVPGNGVAIGEVAFGTWRIGPKLVLATTSRHAEAQRPLFAKNLGLPKSQDV
jgi:hypothetical protein